MMQAMYLGDAALCYKKVDPAEALKLWQTSGDLLVDAGKYARAAKTFQVRRRRKWRTRKERRRGEEEEEQEKEKEEVKNKDEEE